MHEITIEEEDCAAFKTLFSVSVGTVIDERQYQRKSKPGQWHRACGNKTRVERKKRSKAK